MRYACKRDEDIFCANLHRLGSDQVRDRQYCRLGIFGKSMGRVVKKIGPKPQAASRSRRKRKRYESAKFGAMVFYPQLALLILLNYIHLPQATTIYQTTVPFI